MSVRPIRPDDVPAVVGLVRELAEYEKALDEVRLTEEQLTASLFGDAPALFGHVAVADDGVAPGEVVGMALWFLNFSTWRGTHGIYLEDLYVQPAHRGTGLGRRILARLDQIALEHGCRAVRLDTSDYLTPAVGLYRSAGYREVPAYNENPKADLWFERSLRD